MKQRTTLRAAAACLRSSLTTLKLKTFTSTAAFLFTFATVLPAEVHQYTGLDYTMVSGSPYSTAQALTGTFTLNNPLAMSATNFDATAAVTPWTVNDGVNTLCDTCMGSSLVALTFSTNLAGDITDWYFDATHTGSAIEVSSEGPLAAFPNTDHAVTDTNNATSVVAGSWQDTTTPEPGTLGMMFAGSLLLFGTMRRRAGRASRQA